MLRVTLFAALAAVACFAAGPALANKPDGHVTLPQSSDLLKQKCGGQLAMCTWCSTATGNCYQVTGCDGSHCTVRILFPNAVLRPGKGPNVANQSPKP